MKKQFVIVSELVQFLNKLVGCKFVSVVYETSIESNNKKLQGGKSNPFYGRVSSITATSGIQYGASYENAVNNRLTDKSFKAEQLPWGEWMVANKTISHKGEVYVRLYATKAINSKTIYFVDGVRAENQGEVAAAFRQKSESKRQSEVGIEKADQVKPFNINVKSIREFTVDGLTYNVAALMA